MKLKIAHNLGQAIEYAKEKIAGDWLLTERGYLIDWRFDAGYINENRDKELPKANANARCFLTRISGY